MQTRRWGRLAAEPKVPVEENGFRPSRSSAVVEPGSPGRRCARNCVHSGADGVGQAFKTKDVTGLCG